MSGLPAFPTLQSGYGYPIHWLLTDVPSSTAINWLLAGHTILAGLGAVWCAARLGAPREGQLLSGLAFALGSAVTARLWAGHMSFVKGLAWLPIATGLAIGMPSAASLLLLPLSVGLMALAGQPELVIFSAWWLPLWAAYGAWGRRRRLVLPAILLTGLCSALGVALAAYQLLPSYELYQVSNRQTGMSWDFRTQASLPPWQRWRCSPRLPWHARTTGTRAGAELGMARALSLCRHSAAIRREPGRRSMALALLGVSVGDPSAGIGSIRTLVRLGRAEPGYSMFRIPSRHLCLTALALSLAAGLGIRRLHGPRVGVVALGATFALVVTALQFAWRIPVPTIAGDGWELLRLPTPPASVGFEDRGHASARRAWYSSCWPGSRCCRGGWRERA